MFFAKLYLLCIPVCFVFRMPQSILHIRIRIILAVKLVYLLLKLCNLDLVLKDVAYVAGLEAAADCIVGIAGDVSGKPREA